MAGILSDVSPPSLLFGAKDYPGAPAPTDEESITFKSFLDSLDKGLVAKVDFLSGGDKAYAFLKPSGGGDGELTRIRVGQGYPDEQGNGWSSPLWVVRALNDRKVRCTFFFAFLSLKLCSFCRVMWCFCVKIVLRICFWLWSVAPPFRPCRCHTRRARHCIFMVFGVAADKLRATKHTVSLPFLGAEKNHYRTFAGISLVSLTLGVSHPRVLAVSKSHGRPPLPPPLPFPPP